MQTSRRSCWCHGNCITDVNIETLLLVLWPELFGSTQVRAASISWCCSEGCWLARGLGAARLCDIKTLRLTNDLWRCPCPRSYVILLFAEQKAIATCIDVFFWEHHSPLESCFFWLISSIISEEYLPHTDRVKNLLACSLHQKKSFLLSRQVTQYL